VTTTLQPRRSPGVQLVRLEGHHGLEPRQFRAEDGPRAGADDDLPVSGGPGDTVIAAELGDVVLASEPAQDQYRLPERGSGHGCLWECRVGAVRPAAIGQRSEPVRGRRRAWHDEQTTRSLSAVAVSCGENFF
jgi:hypothetical protein